MEENYEKKIRETLGGGISIDKHVKEEINTEKLKLKVLKEYGKEKLHNSIHYFRSMKRWGRFTLEILRRKRRIKSE